MTELLPIILRSLVRTLTPVVVGALVFLAAKVGFDWTPSPEDTLTVAGIITAVFYTLVRLAEEKFGSKWGWLLGAEGAPTYDASARGDLSGA